MNTKTVIVHCTYADSAKDIADIIRDSFRIFLQKELGTFATAAQDGVS